MLRKQEEYKKFLKDGTNSPHVFPLMWITHILRGEKVHNHKRGMDRSSQKSASSSYYKDWWIARILGI